MSGWNEYDMLIQMLLPLNGESAMSRWLLVLSGLIPGGVVMLFGFYVQLLSAVAPGQRAVA